MCFCLVVVSKETGNIRSGVHVRGEIGELGPTERKPPYTARHPGPVVKVQVGTACATRAARGSCPLVLKELQPPPAGKEYPP